MTTRGSRAKRRSRLLRDKRRAKNGHLIRTNPQSPKPKKPYTPKPNYSNYMPLQAPGDPKNCTRFVRRRIKTRKARYVVQICQFKVSRFDDPKRQECLYTEEGNSACQIYRFMTQPTEFKAGYESSLARLCLDADGQKSGLRFERIEELRRLGMLSLDDNAPYDKDFTIGQARQYDALAAEAMEATDNMKGVELLFAKRGLNLGEIEKMLKNTGRVTDEVAEEFYDTEQEREDYWDIPDKDKEEDCEEEDETEENK